MYMCMRLRKIQTSSRGDAYYECTWKTLRCLWKEQGRLLVTQRKQWRWRKLIIPRVHGVSRRKRKTRDGEGKRKGDECVMKERRWTYWCQWHLRKSCRLYDGGLLLASWFCRAQFCSRTTAKTRRIVTLKMRLPISRFPAFPAFAVFK